MRIHHGFLLLASTCAMCFGAQSASAHVLQVGTCTDAVPNFPTIQSAINAAFANDTVAICPGSYPEQIVVTRSVSLTNVKGMASPSIVVPTGGVVQNTTTLDGFPTAAQILVAPASTATVNIKKITVDGTGNNVTTCGMELMGIYYQNAGGKMTDNTVENQLLPDGFQGCQSGEGIFVENATAGTGKITIKGNNVNNFDKNGITVSFAATNADISKNTVTGIGPTTLIAQNGIQVGYNATGNVSSNTVSNLIYSPNTAGSSGILLYNMQAGNYLAPSTIEKNTVTSAQYGVVLDAVDGSAGNLVQVSANKISNAQFAGIGLYSDNGFSPPLSDDYISVATNNIQNTNPYDSIDACSDNNTITKNTIINSSGESAIHLDGLCQEPDGSTSGVSNSVSGNRITVACVGILSGPLQGANTIGSNRFSDVTTDIVYGQDSDSCGPHADRQLRAANGANFTPPASLKPARR